jgi:hypothetical protein
MTQPDSKRRTDGRRQLLLYMAPDLIRTLKQKSLDEDRPVYLIVEEILAEKLTEQGQQKRDVA